jgi:branched-chain amino acid transport system substrate-binding protein
MEPDDVAALTHDSLGLLCQAIKDAGKLDRQAIRYALAKVEKFDGVTGNAVANSGRIAPRAA